MQVLTKFFGHDFVAVLLADRVHRVGRHDAALGEIYPLNRRIGNMRQFLTAEIALFGRNLPPIVAELENQIVNRENRLGFF